MPIKKITVAFEFPLSPIKLSADWEPGEHEREAAWEMYVELATRVTVVELPADRGLVREALNSYYSLFATTREILKKYGPKVARPQGKGSTSFGQLAIVILNELLRPFLSEWHPALQDWETRRGEQESSLSHERSWKHHGEIRDALERTRVQLELYASYLAEVAEVPTLGTLAG
ncbi:MAG TPA: hypothetical protein VK730_10920 [Solirubrobacteraceae bacterium]|jgi:hypothetical protein|nr:hypothetical protein [Solirubrobacteraceae bacterium]